MSGEQGNSSHPVVGLDKIYVKDLSLEIPRAPQVFTESESPKVDLQLSTQAASVGAGMYEVVIMATVTAKAGEKVAFLIEVKQAGIFQVRNISAEDLEAILAVMCPNILYPYLREVISDVSTRAGFIPVVLNPINFDTLYQQQKQQQVQAAATTH